MVSFTGFYNKCLSALFSGTQSWGEGGGGGGEVVQYGILGPLCMVIMIICTV